MSLAQETLTSNVITLKGSTAIVKEFFNYSVNSILYQRGIYPFESFKRTSGYGLTMMVTTDESLVSYMNNILRQLEGKAWSHARCDRLLSVDDDDHMHSSLHTYCSVVAEWQRAEVGAGH
jgi:mitotic spindle assembly checkpoint protein MAD2